MKRVWAVLLAGVLLLSGCSFSIEEPLIRQEFIFDTVVTLKIYDSGCEKAADGFMERCREYQALLSRTVEGSDIWNINHAGGRPTQVSPETLELLRLSLDGSAKSKGAFAVTIGAVTSLWDFHADSPVIPDPQALQQALETVDDRGVRIEGNEVTLTVPGAQLDLGAVAKGYIADWLCEYLSGQGVTSAVLNLGGNVSVLGDKSNGRKRRIGIRSPFGDGEMGVTELRSGSVVTSGVYQRCFDIDGRRYHHIIDTATGYPVENGLESVTILSERSADGDLYSTLCFCLGPEDGMAFIERTPGIEGIFILSNGEIHLSSGASLEQQSAGPEDFKG